jgi:hypothetical protein
VDEAASASASWRCSETERPRHVVDGPRPARTDRAACAAGSAVSLRFRFWGSRSTAPRHQPSCIRRRPQARNARRYRLTEERSGANPLLIPVSGREIEHELYLIVVRWLPPTGAFFCATRRPRPGTDTATPALLLLDAAPQHQPCILRTDTRPPWCAPQGPFSAPHAAPGRERRSPPRSCLAGCRWVRTCILQGEQYGSGAHAAEARQRVAAFDEQARKDADEKAWTDALRGGTAGSFNMYLQNFANGAHAAEARQRMTEPRVAGTPRGPRRRHPDHLPGGRRRNGQPAGRQLDRAGRQGMSRFRAKGARPIVKDLSTY